MKPTVEQIDFARDSIESAIESAVNYLLEGFDEVESKDRPVLVSAAAFIESILSTIPASAYEVIASAEISPEMKARGSMVDLSDSN